MRVRPKGGNTGADADACREADFGPVYLTRTIEILNPHADPTRRVSNRRSSWLGDLSRSG